MKQKGFTLSEAMLIILLMGVLAAILAPSLILTSKTIDIKPSYRKAVFTINDAIQTNIAKGERSPFSAGDLSAYLRKPLEVLSYNNSFTWADGKTYKTFVTLDKTRYLIGNGITVGGYKLKSSNCGNSTDYASTKTAKETAAPCIIIADVNGDKGPNLLTTGSTMNDAFFIVVTAEGAKPLGTVAEKIFYKDK